jgi:hypothetical protein
MQTCHNIVDCVLAARQDRISKRPQVSLQNQRNTLGVSGSKLARKAGRFRIWTYGIGLQTMDTQSRIRQVLHAEPERLRNISVHIEGSEPSVVEPRMEAG